jgi:hypothetical protein
MSVAFLQRAHLELECVQGQIDVAKKENERNDQADHAGNEEADNGHGPADLQNDADEQYDDENSGEKNAQSRERYGGTNDVGTPQQDLHLSCHAPMVLAAAIPELVPELPGSVDDPAEAVRHRQEEQAHTGDENDRANRNLKDRDEVLKGHDVNSVRAYEAEPDGWSLTPNGSPGKKRRAAFVLYCQAPQKLGFSSFDDPLIGTSGQWNSNRINMKSETRTCRHSQVHPLPESLHQAFLCDSVPIRNHTIVFGEY